MSEASINTRLNNVLSDIEKTKSNIKIVKRNIDILTILNKNDDLVKYTLFLIKLRKKLHLLKRTKIKLKNLQKGFWSKHPYKIRKLLAERDYWKQEAMKYKFIIEKQGNNNE
jgi:CRISPR/Cas system-associated protein Cas5 (RAMP superfamily)